MCVSIHEESVVVQGVTVYTAGQRIMHETMAERERERTLPIPSKFMGLTHNLEPSCK